MKLMVTFCVSLLMVAGGAAMAAPAGYVDTEFSAPVREIRVQMEYLVKGSKLDDVITVHAPALLFDEPLVIEDVRTADLTALGERLPPESLVIVRYVRANLDGGPEDVLAFWRPADRPDLGQLVHNAELFRRNREHLERQPGLELLGQVRLGGHTVVLERRLGMVLSTVVDGTASGYQLSQSGPSDNDLAVIEAAIARRLGRR